MRHDGIVGTRIAPDRRDRVLTARWFVPGGILCGLLRRACHPGNPRAQAFGDRRQSLPRERFRVGQTRRPEPRDA